MEEALEKIRWKNGNELLEEAVKRKEVKKENGNSVYGIHADKK